MKAIICLGAGKSQEPFIREIKRSGYFLILVDRQNCNEVTQLSDVFIQESTYDTEQVLNKLDELDQQLDIIAMIARVSGPALYTAAAISEKYKLHQLSSKLSELSTVKSALRDFCTINNIQVPQGIKMSSFDYENISSQFDNHKVVLKPDLPIIGKKDVYISTPQNVSTEIFNKCSESSFNHQVEIEDYIEGIDVSCLFQIHQGKAINLCLWDEFVGLKNNTIKGLGVSIPSVEANNETLRDNIQSVINKFAVCFENISGFLVLSFRITPDNELYVIELHCDLTGDSIAEKLLPHAIAEDFNFFKWILKHTVNSSLCHSALKIKRPTLIANDETGSQIIHNKTIQENINYLSSNLPTDIIMPKHSERIT